MVGSCSLPRQRTSVGRALLTAALCGLVGFGLPGAAAAQEPLPGPPPMVGDPGWTPETAVDGFPPGAMLQDPQTCFDCGPTYSDDSGYPRIQKQTELGIGATMIPWGSFEIEPARPLNHIRLRYDAVHNYQHPDRTQYFQATSGSALGPPFADGSIDYQDFRIMMEVGGSQISVVTEIPIRSIDAENNGNTTGPGDMSVAPKVMFLNENGLQVSTIIRTYILTGYSRRGIGTGHVSMEPGLLVGYQLSCTTYLHGELKYWFPIGTLPEQTGTVWRYGVGVSHLLYERPNTDFAVTTTLELVGLTFNDGIYTEPSGITVPVDGETAVVVYPGVRFLLSNQVEVGLGSGFALTHERTLSEMLRLDLRILF